MRIWKKSLIVFGGKSKKNTDFVKGIISEIEFNKENSCLNTNLINHIIGFCLINIDLRLLITVAS